jgi:hypothetical protein
MPNLSRRVRPAIAASAVRLSRAGSVLTSRSLCQIESTPLVSTRSIQRQKPETVSNEKEPKPKPRDTCAMNESFACRNARAPGQHIT